MTTGLTRRTYRCPDDATLIFEEEQPLSAHPSARCPHCLAWAQRYYGPVPGQKPSMPAINLGWRGAHGYATQEDARIAQYQFEHL